MKEKITRAELNTAINEQISGGRVALETVRATIAPGQWQKLWENREFVRFCGIFHVEQ